MQDRTRIEILLPSRDSEEVRAAARDLKEQLGDQGEVEIVKSHSKSGSGDGGVATRSVGGYEILILTIQVAQLAIIITQFVRELRQKPESSRSSNMICIKIPETGRAIKISLDETEETLKAKLMSLFRRN